MITYPALISRPKIFARLTGHTPEEFDYLFDKFKSAYEEKLRSRRFDSRRKRADGAGRPSHLKTWEDKLLFILLYVRIYPLLFVHGLMFNLSESNACYWVHEYLPILDKALGYAHKKPVRIRGRGLDEIIAEFPELVELGLLGDGTERPTRKPQNKDHRKSWYSGKKKRHTRKNVLLTRPDNTQVLYLGKTQDGNVHDKKALEEEALSVSNIRDPVPLGLDLGFAGTDITGLKIVIPMKKPKGKELTELQKSQNHTFAQIRVRVENAICGVKRSHAVADSIMCEWHTVIKKCNISLKTGTLRLKTN
ncbi:MAG: Transposase, IS4 family protein [Candidatus Gottesmanbacteria bacterium GW2011_GWB1_43_11]|uniref:Transposase, IS4 family protein n=1 Tax=Candidatus Gottesmanbacteria bacterium GW2011_GWB1_43_11 TaxID=1618446 RepID=A0A0G1CF32_9BACT|nr:MAG: Transposase, IS4 family protein [Candidatus Gottesmanbacteria bacterium GW2011_GWB1_43_11]